MSAKVWAFLFVMLGVLGGLIAWRLHNKSVMAANQARQREARMKAPPEVSVSVAQGREIAQTFNTIGTVDAPASVKITPKITGRVTYLAAREGDAVTQGEMLARLDPSDAEAQLHQKQAALAETQQRLEQAQIGQGPNDVQVATQLRQQEAAVASAEANHYQLVQNYESQVAAAEAAVTDVQGRVDAAKASIANAQAGIGSAEANLENAQVSYDRTYRLYKQGFVAPQDVDNARTQVNVQKAGVEVARGQLRSATAARDSALAQLHSAQNQLKIARTKGQADIQAAQAQVSQAKAALQMAQANTAQKSAYQRNLAALRADVEAAQAGVADAQAALSDTVLQSPLTGFVTARYIDSGSVASPSQPILAVASTRQVWVTVQVPEDIYRGVRLGQSGTITFDALPGRSVIGRVTQVNRAADPTSRQFSVRFTVDNSQGSIIPGMSAHVTLTTQQVNAPVVVPPEAVQQGAGGATVMVVSPQGIAQQRAVTLGAADANGVQITSGVSPGEQVVVLSGVPVRDGQRVRVVGSPGGSGAGSLAGHSGAGRSPGGGKPGQSPSPAIGGRAGY